MELRFHTFVKAKVPALWSAFERPDNIRRWLAPVEFVQSLEGKAGQQGSVSQLKAVIDGREVVIRERVRYRQDKVAFDAEYTSDLGTTNIENRFLPAEGGSMWILELTHRFRGLYLIQGFFMRSSIEKYLRADLDRVKSIIEKR